MIKICLICKEQFKVRPSRFLASKTCSMKCRNNFISKISKGKGRGKENVFFGKTHSAKTKKFLSDLGKIACKGQGNPNWKGGRYLRSDNYWAVYQPNHPYARKNYVFEHRLVMEKHIGRYLNPEEVVHHINNDRKDNRISNLRLYNNNKVHLDFHRKN